MPIFIVLCGKTGSGKTLLLQQLESSGYPCIHLERIASHRGSAFGDLLLPSQPSQKDFEKQLQQALLLFEHKPYIFIEQKASSIGKRKIPAWLYSQMNEGIAIQLNTDKTIRIQNILNEYSAAGKNNFMKASYRLEERLPTTTVQEAVELLEQENYYTFIEKMLDYYDATVNYNPARTPVVTMTIQDSNTLSTMKQLLQALQRVGIIPISIR